MVDKPKRLELTPEELLKVNRARAKDKRVSVNEEWLFLSEFGYYYGFDGVRAIRNNEITFQEAEKLLIGARKIWDSKLYDHMLASFIGSVTAKTKKPFRSFIKATKDIIKRTKADTNG